MKEKTECSRNYNINFKTPVFVRNCLPCNLKIRTDLILGKLSEKQLQYSSTKRGNEGDTFEYEQKEFLVQRGETLKLHNFNLKQDVHFLYTLDTTAGIEGQNSFQWGEFRASND